MASKGIHGVGEDALVNTKQARKVLSRVNLLEESNSLAIDIGGNLAKLLYLAPDGTPPPVIEKYQSGGASSSGSALSVRVPELAGKLHFWAFETRHVSELVDFVRDHWDTKERKVIRATGGGSYKYAEMFRTKIDVDLSRIDELKCSVAGLNFLLHYVDNEVFVFRRNTLPNTQNRENPAAVDGQRVFLGKTVNPFPYLLVNLGTGVSIVKVTGHGQFERISGSALGGGTFWGLARLLLNCKSFDDVIELTNNGNHSNVDMLVGDIYGGAYKNIELDEDVIAASFGKATMLHNRQHDISMYQALVRAIKNTWNLWLAFALTLPIIGSILSFIGIEDPFRVQIANIALSNRFKAEDVAISLLRMVAYNIGQIAYLNARLHGLERIYFGGNFVRNHPHTIADVSFAVDFWSQGKSKAHFMKHDGYLGAIGAFIGGQSESPTKHVQVSPRDKKNTAGKQQGASSSTTKKKKKKSQTAASTSIDRSSSAITEDINGNGNGSPAEKKNASENGDPGATNGTNATNAANGTTKKRSRKARAKGAANANGNANGGTNGTADANGDANGNGNGNNDVEVVYYDDPHDEAVQEVMAGEWSVINRRGKRKAQ